MEQLRRIAWIPVLWGVITDTFLTTIMSQLVALLIGVTPDTAPDIAQSLLRASPYFWPSFVAGILFSGAGGFLAARLARREGVFHGTLTAFISNIFFSLLLSGADLDMIGMIGIMLAIVAGTVGGWLATRGLKSEA